MVPYLEGFPPDSWVSINHLQVEVLYIIIYMYNIYIYTVCYSLVYTGVYIYSMEGEGVDNEQ